MSCCKKIVDQEIVDIQNSLKATFNEWKQWQIGKADQTPNEKILSAILLAIPNFENLNKQSKDITNQLALSYIKSTT